MVRQLLFVRVIKAICNISSVAVSVYNEEPGTVRVCFVFHTFIQKRRGDLCL